MDTRGVAVATLLAVLYAVGVIYLAPISFQLFQVRIADTLLPLSIVFGIPAVVGLSLGTVVANSVSPFGPIDIIGGTLANFVATYVGWKLGQMHFKGRDFFATVSQNLIITLIVGTYLQFLLQIPDTHIFGITIGGLLISWLGVFLGSAISINIAGYGLLKALRLRLPPTLT